MLHRKARRCSPLLFLGCLVLLGAVPASADRLVPRSGKPVRGALMSESGGEVVFNPYWSKNPGMVYQVIRLPATRVKRVEVEPHPEVEVFRRLAAQGTDDVGALLEIAAYAKENKLKAHARMCLAYALVLDPGNLDALKRIGGRSKFESARKGNIHLDAELKALLADAIATDDASARQKKILGLRKAGFPGKAAAIERHRRSLTQPKGLQADRPLAWRSDELPGAVYTLFVPPAYDPVTPWPLIVGLHGGGADGKQHDEVVGNGRSAMNFYRDLAGRHGFLVACPSALQAGWGAKPNEDLVRAVIEELKRLYNIDLDRIYMTGHSMGGFGTWALGPRLAEDLAAISPMAGGGGGGVSTLVKTRTPIFIYHSDNDYVSVNSDRQAAKRLQGTDLDFVYTELPGKGHAFPESIRHELFAFFAPRRRHDPAHKDVWPRSSLIGKVTKAEERYLGDPLASLEGRTEELDDWIDQLRLGGGRAAIAAARIGETRSAGAVAAVAKVLKDAKVPFSGRALAARALGLLGDPAGAKALQRAVALPAERDQSRVAIEAARALVALQAAEVGGALGRAIEAWTVFYEGKLTGGAVCFSDWQRAVPVLAVLVDARATLDASGDVESLSSGVVARVLGPKHEVETSERVPQDVSSARVALAKAVARAYAAWGADAEVWDALAEAVSNDPRAKAVVGSAR